MLFVPRIRLLAESASIISNPIIFSDGFCIQRPLTNEAEVIAASRDTLVLLIQIIYSLFDYLCRNIVKIILLASRRSAALIHSQKLLFNLSIDS